MVRRARIFPGSERIVTIPAPIGGLNATDTVAAMPPTDAVSLVNWYPDTLGVKCRKGFVQWATGFPGNSAIESILSYVGPSTPPGSGSVDSPTSVPGALFAATRTGIYTITSKTSNPTLSRALSGADNAGWISSVQMTTVGGSFLLCCSEADGYFYYDGTSWVNPSITNVSAANLVHVSVFKRRAWFVERNSTRAWYLPVDSIGGGAQPFDFGQFFKRGGHLAYIANWTIDAGEGIDDFLVAVSSGGDVVIYKGIDPSSASTFSLVGTWYVGQIPIGRRGYVQYGGDLLLMSAEGIYPISLITRGGSEFLSASSKDYASKIRTLIGQDLRQSFNLRGWQAVVHPSERLLLLNVPNYGNVINRQYALSTSLNGWGVFSGIPIYSLGATFGYTFAGSSNGIVYLLFTGAFDNVPISGTGGTAIQGAIVPAYSYLDGSPSTKHILMIRPNFLALEAPNILVGVNVNFNNAPPTGSPTISQIAEYRWNASQWNSASWGGGQKVFSNWTSAGAIGFSAAASLATVTLGDTTLTSIDYMFASGGSL